ncbi:NAD(P)H-dependent oxidoreductase subunit E [bacterium]|nr:NAD(P)H-dependent oxidoreductase subunit E [bacterium]
MPEKRAVERAATARSFEKVCRILDSHHRQPSRLIPILQEIQHEYRYLPEEVLTFVATSLGLPPARVYGVATFYAHFALEPKGKYVVRLCDGTACHVKHSTTILDALRAKLGLAGGTVTTRDMLFTVETVSCLGACGLAPVMVVNETVYGQMTPEKATAVLDEIIAKEKNESEAE